MKIFNEQHEMFRQAVRAFVDKEVAPHAEAWEAEGRIPRSVWPRMGALGFLGDGLAERIHSCIPGLLAEHSGSGAGLPGRQGLFFGGPLGGERQAGLFHGGLVLPGPGMQRGQHAAHPAHPFPDPLAKSAADAGQKGPHIAQRDLTDHQ